MPPSDVIFCILISHNRGVSGSDTSFFSVMGLIWKEEKGREGWRGRRRRSGEQ